MEEEREWRIGRWRIRERAREGKGEGGKRKREPGVEEPYFVRSSAGVQILNRILDECISLTRLRPVRYSESPRLAEERRRQSARGWLRRRGARRGGRRGRDRF